jgi:hypothetical protein
MKMNNDLNQNKTEPYIVKTIGVIDNRTEQATDKSCSRYSHSNLLIDKVADYSAHFLTNQVSFQ